MLLEQISISNFRQFIDTEIVFSSADPNRNVTLIFGDNGAGKTTLAQAFLWCLYGVTDFNAQSSILNKDIEKNMTPSDDSKEVTVSIRLNHNGKVYRLIRKHFFKKDYSNTLTLQKKSFDIEYKECNGEICWVKDPEGFVEMMLPRALSKYFFFDGERIEKMSKDISASKKSNDFAEAVKGLLGLDALTSAIKHFNPKSKYSVIGKYAASFDRNSNTEMGTLVDEIDKLNTKRTSLENRLEEIENNIEDFRAKKTETETEIKQYDQIKELQLKRSKLESDLAKTKKYKEDYYKEVFKNFTNGAEKFFATAMIKQTAEILKNQDLNNKYIPSIDLKTLQYLLKNKTCLCGTNLEENEEARRTIERLQDFLPPNSIGMSLNNFRNSAKMVLSDSTNLFDDLSKNIETLSVYTDDINDTENQLRDIEEEFDALGETDAENKIQSLNKVINVCKTQIASLSNEQMKKAGEHKECEVLLKQKTKRQQEIAANDKKNQKVQCLKTYAEAIYASLVKYYDEQEKGLREKLQDTINKNFKTIYDGGLHLFVDEKYHISIFDDKYSDNVQASTGQNVAAIFAFITSIIEIAKENDSAKKLTSSEPYPLVMDAPLSSFDKKRIETGCKAIPQIADQVVIFIKNTDGEIAEQFIGDKIANKYVLRKETALKTTIERVDS